MKRKAVFLGIILLVIINLSALATIGYHRWCRYSEKCPYNTGEHSEENYLYRQLSLSESQIEDMKALRKSFHLQADKICSVLPKRRTELVELLQAYEPDSEKINLTLSGIDSMQAKLQKQVIYYLLKVKEILTPEQQQKYFSIIKERLLREARHHQTNGLYPMENSCNVKYQESNGCPKNDERR